jgi:hypothetical protein
LEGKYNFIVTFWGTIFAGFAKARLDKIEKFAQQCLAQ